MPGNATNGTRSYTANGLNQYTAAVGSAVTHDANGNLAGNGTWTYGYDQNNRLKSATKTGTSAALAYDAEGRLRQSIVTAGTAATVNKAYDGVDLVAEYDAAGTLQRRWVHGPGVDEPLVAYEGTTTASKSWLYADHLGSIVAAADAAGTSTAVYSYGPVWRAQHHDGATLPLYRSAADWAGPVLLQGAVLRPKTRQVPADRPNWDGG